jgi:hypothetical protein
MALDVEEANRLGGVHERAGDPVQAVVRVGHRRGDVDDRNLVKVEHASGGVGHETAHPVRFNP